MIFELCDLEIWRMTLKEKQMGTSSMLLQAFSIIQTGVTVHKRPIWVKIDKFF